MKKIKSKIINTYNECITFFNNLISKKIRKIQISHTISNFFNNFIRLDFVGSSNVKISVFNKYLILFIIFLFSFLFYLSIPTIYNYTELQKQLTNKILKEFNLNSSLSANIIYKILPSPNFEISNVILNSEKENQIRDYAHVKKMKIYISMKNLYNQKKLEIKNIALIETNIDISKETFKYLKDYIVNRDLNKKILLKKSKIFFKEKTPEKKIISMSKIYNAKLFYDKKNINRLLYIQGSIYNSRYNLIIDKDNNKKNTIITKLKLKKLNLIIENEFTKHLGEEPYFSGKSITTFLGSEIKVNYEILKKKINFKSIKSKINNSKIGLDGEINISPFYYNININIEKINIPKFFKDFSRIKNLLNEKILLNKKFNGKITINIQELKGTKLFNRAIINLSILNGKLLLNDTQLISDKIGKAIFLSSVLESSDDSTFVKSKILFEVLNQKKFYQKLQVPKKNQIDLKNIYLQIEKTENINQVKINELTINKNLEKENSKKSKNLADDIDFLEFDQMTNWISVKKFANYIFSELSEIN